MSYETPTYTCADCTREVSEDSGEIMEGGFCEDCAPFHKNDIEIVPAEVRARYQELGGAA